ncbi:tryptophan 2,3-dioxygenase family protein [Hymenobacter humi]|uniref:Tryptophan 2,3-dioxygenase family protein n=1 Tax=Hymenobacter humi TaxID=1411620 RepID=A0ABW2U9N5_9BACT
MPPRRSFLRPCSPACGGCRRNTPPTAKTWPLTSKACTTPSTLITGTTSSLDTLLSLQRPLTNLPDERIFIMYHQISELYFKLCLCEYEQIGDLAEPTLGEVVLRLGRINRYFENLIDSFDVMVDGMDKQQFLDFRMALMPASGFQSVQYRKIEIASTSLENLTDKAKRQALGEASAHDYDQMLGCIYWKAGATIEASGAKALTLIEFERKYTADLVRHAEAYHDRNVWAVVQRLPEEDRTHPRLLRALRQARHQRERKLAADALQIGRALPAAQPHRRGGHRRHQLAQLPAS